ncbi:MAG: hypothetical protein AB7W16_00915 [Candidatus Obscuribacterales bacterium]
MKKMFLTAIACLCMAFCAHVFVACQYDWGYNLVAPIVERISQVADLDDGGRWMVQGLLALILSVYVIPSLVAAVTAGYLKAHFGGTWRWSLTFALFNLFPLLLPIFLSPELLLNSEFYSKLFSRDFTAIFGEWDIELVGILALFIAILQVVMAVACRLFEGLSVRTRPWKVLGPGLGALAAYTLLFWFVEGPGLPVYDGSVMVLGAAWAAYLCRTGTWSGALVSGFLTMFPVCLFNLSNIAVDMLFLVSGGIESQFAFVSALAIASWSLACTVFGSWFGYRLRRKRS